MYDSLFTSYNVLFGPGYRQDLQEQYRNIQEREGIMTSLLPEDQAAREANQRTDILVRNRKVFTAFRRELRKAGLSPQTVEGHVATIADFASTTLVEAEPPRGVLELTVADIESYVRGKPAKQPELQQGNPTSGQSPSNLALLRNDFFNKQIILRVSLMPFYF
jgi:hypothetical protein